jgi:murein DD-endopeptidase MepM/ murein hydrolase activator NlpD
MMLPIKNGKITFPYGAKYKTGKTHLGDDFAVPTGTPVYACVAGTIVHSGKHIFKKGWGFAFGIHVIVDNVRFPDGSAGLWAGYCHLSKTNVQVGQVIKKGDVIGFVGSTGNSTGSHLHLQILASRTWNPLKAVNPKKWINA